MSLRIDDRLVCRVGWDCVSSNPARQTVSIQSDIYQMYWYN